MSKALLPETVSNKLIKPQMARVISAIHAIDTSILQCALDTAIAHKELKIMAKECTKPSRLIKNYVVSLEGSTKAQRTEMLALLQQYKAKDVWSIGLYTHLTHKAVIAQNWVFKIDDGKWSTIQHSSIPANSNITAFIIALRHATKG